jgi:hypothetical protein
VVLTSAVTAPTSFVLAGTAMLMIYLLALVIFDRYLSSRPSRDLLLRFLRDLEERLHGKPLATATVTEAQKRLTPKHRWYPISVTKVLSTWREAHRLDGVSWHHAGKDAIDARLTTVQAELLALDRPDAAALAVRVGKVLDPTPKTPPRPRGVVLRVRGRSWQFRIARQNENASAGVDPQRPELLREALRIVYDARDTKFESLADLQTKAVWLSVLGLLFIALAAIAEGRQFLFLFGALGAFVSRLGRLLHRKPADTDYGASSGSIFLSPVAGAIAGWLGVALAAALSSASIHVLSDTFQEVWSNPVGPLPFLIATVFGFSERLLNRVLTTAEQTIDGKSASGSTTS